MIIDFHVHFFPDPLINPKNDNLVKAISDGSELSLLKNMENEKINLSINLPIAIKSDQVIQLNRKIMQLNQNNKALISFGSMHPDFYLKNNIKEELEEISKNGIKGIKLHPEYQLFYPDDPKMAVVYETCVKLGLIIVIYTGNNPDLKNNFSIPKRVAEVAKINGIKLIIPHLGGYQLWKDVERYLVGIRDVFFDTASTEEMENWQMKEIIMGHGAYKILFGSNFPWQSPQKIIQKIQSLGLGKDFEDMIFYKNAKSLLGI